jgi:Zn-dependent peptidase ImmA (M78 family)
MTVDYKRLDKLAISIYIDYNLNSFPIDVFDLAKRMGIKVLKYSAFEGEMQELLLKRSKDGFYSPSPNGPLIFYNDFINNEFKIRMTIAHEIKHYVCQDTEEDNELFEKEAKHFARYLLCPIPYLIFKNILSVFEIMDTFGLSNEAATNALSNVNNRTNRYGDRIFDYEKPLLELLKNKKS